jgi:rhodanese-related sulfurtransferase
MSFFKKLFGLEPKINFAQLVAEGAIIVDVRTFSEFKNGHISASTNIPLNTLQNNLRKIKKDTVIITCCASGIRSASAKNIFESNGFQNIHNGGGWSSLNRKI